MFLVTMVYILWLFVDLAPVADREKLTAVWEMATSRKK